METLEKNLSKDGYHHGDLRAGLIEATRRLVEEKGPEGFSVSEACRLAGVSTAAPYKHFKDRDDMLVSMVLEGMGRHFRNMQAVCAPYKPGDPARITAVGLEYVNFALREHGVFRLKFGGFTDRLNDPRLEAAGRQTFDYVLHEVAACLGTTEITDEVRRRGLMLWSFVHGLSFITADAKLNVIAGCQDIAPVIAEMTDRVLAPLPK